MPYTADVDTIAEQVQVGDYYRMINGASAPQVKIAEVKVGTKWTVARDADYQLIFRKENEEQVWVLREVPTEEELAAEAAAAEAANRVFQEDRLAELVNVMEGKLQKATEELVTRLAKGYSGGEDVMGEVIEGQEFARIASELREVRKIRPDMSWLEIFEHMVNGIKDGLVEGRDEPNYSGGFSFSNAARQSRIAARRKFVKSIVWYHI